MVTDLAVVLRISDAKAAFHLWFLTIFLGKFDAKNKPASFLIWQQFMCELNSWTKPIYEIQVQHFWKFYLKFAENSFHSRIFSRCDHDFFKDNWSFSYFFPFAAREKEKDEEKHCFTSQMHLRKISESFIYFSIVT